MPRTVTAAPLRRNIAPRPGNVPAKIKCCRCEIVKDANPHHFSKKWLDKLRDHSNNARNYPKRAQEALEIPCSMCSGGQAVERECALCGEVKPITSFSKSQRKKGDDAECWSCWQEREDFDPEENAAENEDLSDSDYDSDSSFSDDLGSVDDMSSTLDSSFSRLGFRGKAGTGMYSSRTGTSSLGGVSIATNSTARGPTGSYAQSKVNPSAYSSSGRASTTDSSVAPSAERFPKVKPVKSSTAATKPSSTAAADDDSDEDDKVRHAVSDDSDSDSD